MAEIELRRVGTVELKSGDASSLLAVEGMTCGSCVRTVQNAVTVSA
jgi:hypothetical protein